MKNVTLNINICGTSFTLTGRAYETYPPLCTVDIQIDSEYFCAHRKTYVEAAEAVERKIADYYFQRNQEQEENGGDPSDDVEIESYEDIRG